MALGGGGHVFGAVVGDLDRVAALHCQQRGVRADDGREVFFAAEGSAGFNLDDAAFFFRQVEDKRERVDEIIRALHGAAHADGFDVAVGVAETLGDDAVGFDVELLLGAGGVLAFDDEVGLCEGCGEACFGFRRRRLCTSNTA